MSEIEDRKEQRLRRERFHRNWFLAQRVLLSMPACVIYNSKNRFAVIDEKIQTKIQTPCEFRNVRFFFQSFSRVNSIEYIRDIFSSILTQNLYLTNIIYNQKYSLLL